MSLLCKKQKILSMGLVFLLAASSCLGQEKGSDGNWQDQLDGFFKEYAVAPLESLLFWKIPGLEMPLVVLWLLGGGSVLYRAHAFRKHQAFQARY
jgi:hypothetical protein